MEIVVFSDSHGDTATLEQIIKKHKENIDVFLFLGDGIESIEYLEKKYRNLRIFAVKGNNDYGYDYPYDRLVVFDGKNIFMTHGHRQMGGDFKKNIKKNTKENKIDVVLYGHLHLPKTELKDDIYYVCPGSVNFPRGGSKRSYAILSIIEEKISVEILKVGDGY